MQGSFSATNNVIVSANRCGAWSDLSKCDRLKVCAIQLSSLALGDRGRVSLSDDSEPAHSLQPASESQARRAPAENYFASDAGSEDAAGDWMTRQALTLENVVTLHG